MATNGSVGLRSRLAWVAALAAALVAAVVVPAGGVTAEGSLDPSFDVDGKVVTQIGSGSDAATAVVLQSDGKIVAAGYSHNGANLDFALVRYNSNGSLDMSFDSDGKVTTPIGSSDDYAYAVVLQSDGKIVVVGYGNTGTNTDVVLVRYDLDGSLDTTFDGDGKVTTPIGSSNDYAYAAAIDHGGKIVAVGYSAGADADFALVRYIGDATTPFGARVVGVPRYSTSLTRTVAWLASDSGTGVAAFDVRRRSALYTASTYGSWSMFKSNTSLPYGSFTGSAGRTYCFESRGHDFADNTGVYSPPKCVEFPVNDRTLTRHGSWTQGTGTAFYDGTYVSSTSSSAYLTLGVHFRHLAVVVTTCSGCGTIKMYLGSTLLKTINLAASSTRHKVVIDVSSSLTVKTGTLKIKQSSAAKTVTIEGVGASLA